MRIRSYLFHTIVALALASPLGACSLAGSSESALSGEGAGSDAGSAEDCTFTQGYWKNHP
jgi:hypothetical protein